MIVLMPKDYQNGAEQCLELWQPMGKFFLWTATIHKTVSKFKQKTVLIISFML
jgi:hypothetical protein